MLYNFSRILFNFSYFRMAHRVNNYRRYSSSERVNPVKLQRRTKSFPRGHDSCLKPDRSYGCFQVEVFYKLEDVAINQLDLHLRVMKRNFGGLVTFSYPEAMLSLTNDELQAHAETLQQATDIGILKVISFRRQF